MVYFIISLFNIHLSICLFILYFYLINICIYFLLIIHLGFGNQSTSSDGTASCQRLGHGGGGGGVSRAALHKFSIAPPHENHTM